MKINEYIPVNNRSWYQYNRSNKLHGISYVIKHVCIYSVIGCLALMSAYI